MHERFPSLEADDAIQETLLAVWKIIPSYCYAPDEKGRFRNYLTGILRKKSLKRCEKLSHEAALKNDIRLAGIHPPQIVAADEANAEWRKAMMEIAMRQLLADDRIHEQSKQIFQRLTVDGMSPDDVATAYGTSRNNVDKTKSRMIERLREIIHALEAAGNV